MKKSVAIIGGGAAGLAVASFLDPNNFDIHIYEKNKALGRKFLVAGKGGFNLTHSEPILNFIERYTPQVFLKPALSDFSNEEFRHWLNEIGVPTFVGSSKRVYPIRGIKPIQVLDAIVSHLELRNVHVHTQSEWRGWKDKKILIDNTEIEADIVIFALGGSSWKVTGSNGSWRQLFGEQGIETSSFLPSNCGYNVIWEKEFEKKFAGFPLKNIALKVHKKWRKGEVVITSNGLEGGAIYALSPEIRSEINSSGKCMLYLDMKPTLTGSILEAKLSSSDNRKMAERLKKDIKLSKPLIELIKLRTSKEEYQNCTFLASLIKSFPIELIGTASLDEAISTVGGLGLKEINENYALHKLENTYCIGEMLDWDAPTGGYLIQACFSKGSYLAKHLNSEFSQP